MWAVVGASLLAGALGLYANGALEGADYLPRLRIMFLGAAALGYLGPAALVVRKAKGWRRLSCLFLGLLSVRIWYVPALHGALLAAGCVDWAGRALGAQTTAPAVHASLGGFAAALLSVAVLVLLAAVVTPRSGLAIATLLVYALAGVIAFSHPDDRAVLPHAMAAEDLQPAATGPDYLDTAEDDRAPLRTRVVAALYGIADALMPRGGWAQAVRTELHARYRAAPGASLRDRVTSIEGALRTARTTFRTAPRTPPP